jgi:hypothetical protein
LRDAQKFVLYKMDWLNQLNSQEPQKHNNSNLDGWSDPSDIEIDDVEADLIISQPQSNTSASLFTNLRV